MRRVWSLALWLLWCASVYCISHEPTTQKRGHFTWSGRTGSRNRQPITMLTSSTERLMSRYTLNRALDSVAQRGHYRVYIRRLYGHWCNQTVGWGSLVHCRTDLSKTPRNPFSTGRMLAAECPQHSKCWANRLFYFSIVSDGGEFCYRN